MKLRTPAAVRLSALAAVVWLAHAAIAEGAEAAPVCPRPQPGGVVDEPEDLRSENGVL